MGHCLSSWERPPSGRGGAEHWEGGAIRFPFHFQEDRAPGFPDRKLEAQVPHWAPLCTWGQRCGGCCVRALSPGILLGW